MLQLLQSATPVHGCTEHLAPEGDPALVRVHFFQEVVLASLRLPPVNTEEHHTCPEGSRDGIVHPSDLARVDPWLQVAAEVVVDDVNCWDAVARHCEAAVFADGNLACRAKELLFSAAACASVVLGATE